MRKYSGNREEEIQWALEQDKDPLQFSPGPAELSETRDQSADYLNDLSEIYNMDSSQVDPQTLPVDAPDQSSFTENDWLVRVNDEMNKALQEGRKSDASYFKKLLDSYKLKRGFAVYNRSSNRLDDAISRVAQVLPDLPGPPDGGPPGGPPGGGGSIVDDVEELKQITNMSEAEFEEIFRRLDQVDSQVGDMNGRVDSMFDSIGTQVGDMNGKVENVLAWIDYLKGERDINEEELSGIMDKIRMLESELYNRAGGEFKDVPEDMGDFDIDTSEFDKQTEGLPKFSKRELVRFAMGREGQQDPNVQVNPGMDLQTLQSMIEELQVNQDMTDQELQRINQVLEAMGNIYASFV
jgi:tetrahydromethanopterin S-methyltransferase subunit G